MWTEKEERAAARLIELALDEDLGGAGDLTSQALFAAEHQGEADFVARGHGVVAGLPILPMVFAALSPNLHVKGLVKDGDTVSAGDKLAHAGGPLQALLTGERTALNFLQRLSGVATLTHRLVAAAGGMAKILDTRKTTPGWRVLEKYAVRCGGGDNHRMGLFDGVLIKDNHLAGMGDFSDVIHVAVARARAETAAVPIEIEIDSLPQFERALDCRPDLILLDNMTPQQLREAVRRRNERSEGVLLEASGGITLETVAEIAATGIDRISVGALTHSAPALDIGLDYGHDR